MAKVYIVFLLSSLLCVSFGCNRQEQTSLPQETESETNLRQGSFPAFLVGRWKAADQNQYKWGFAFEKDGTVSGMRNFMNMYIDVPEGGTYERSVDANVGSACTLGPVEASFDPNSRILTVRVVTDYFMLHIYDEMLEGSSVDTITGPVSQDGLTWNAEWRNVSWMLDGPPADFNNPTIESVIFYKVKE